MKAEDTVMDYTGDEIIDNLLDTQAEISFKAGVKEVVEWGNEHCPHAGPPDDDPIQIKRHCNKCWQAKLKDWGIS